ncbi:MAG: Flp pilus assembly complex ATPase component TadA [Acidobacteriota bacterium]|nr:MAG: Flp pilus assembly complex ATPase component TadA [Acidobacteriota bacterium]
MQTPKPLGEVLVELGELSQELYEHAVRERRAKMSLIEILREDGRLGQQELDSYRKARQASPNTTDWMVLVDSGLITEEHFLRARCAQKEIDYVEPEIGAIEATLLSRTSFEYLLRLAVLPVRFSEGKLLVMMADPLERQHAAELERIFGMPLEIACCTRERSQEVLRTLERISAGKAGSSSDADLALQYRELEALDDQEETVEEAVQVVDYLLSRAIELGASDLHIEPQKDQIRVRVRLDGVLLHLTDLTADFALRVVSRVKVLSGADIAEKRLHQGGARRRSVARVKASRKSRPDLSLVRGADRRRRGRTPAVCAGGESRRSQARLSSGAGP